MQKLSEAELIRRALDSYVKYSHQSGHYDLEEFREDYQRFGYVIKLLGIYEKRQQLNVRLILNHVVVLYNEFGNDATSFLIYFAATKNQAIIPHLKSLLKFFHRVPTDGFMLVFGEPWDFNKYTDDKSIVEVIESGIKS